MSLPAWGERCTRVLCDHTLPALDVAVGVLIQESDPGHPPTLVVCTDQPRRVEARVSELPVLAERCQLALQGVPGPDGSFMSMSNCHRAALALASDLDRVLLLTADMVVSREILATSEELVRSGWRMVCCVAPRALEDRMPPAGAPGRELLLWAWENRHPMTRDCTWPSGRSYDIWRMYFQLGSSVVARVFLPHPLVAVPQNRSMKFVPTIDVNLVANFPSRERILVTQPEQGAVVELSPADKEYLPSATMLERFEDRSLPSCPSLSPTIMPRHKEFFRKRVVLVGEGGDCGDDVVARRVLDWGDEAGGG